MDVQSSDEHTSTTIVSANDTGPLNPTTTTNPQSQIPKKSLGLLAEVALSQRHYEDMQKQTNENNESNKNDNDQKLQSSATQSSSPKIKTISAKMNRSYTLEQVQKFSDKRLLTAFVEYKRDIKTKRCSYRCQILPLECQIKFDSVGNDQESKSNILQHLREHFSNLEKTTPQIKLYTCRKMKTCKNKTTSSSTTNTTMTMAIKTKPDATILDDDSLPKNQKNSALLTEHAYSCHQTSNENKSKEISNNEIVENKNYVTPTTIAVPTMYQPTSGNAVEHSAQNTVHTIEDVSQTVEVISSDPSVDPPSATDPATQAKLRALALDYIDDIRKKSSSAAKSIIVNGDKSVIYQCKICPDKQFTSTNGLIFHYKKHAGLKPYVCELCQATFTRQHSLNYHMLIHFNKSRFVCQECSRHFRHPSHFKEHMRRHTGETPFQCSDCFIRFKTRNTYKRHLQTKHSKILTSKGIIELPNAVPYQSVPKNASSTSTTLVVASKGGPTVTISGSTATSQQPSTSTTANTIIKPRRKYGIRYLHKNIETITKYEQQQQFQQYQHPTATLITHANTTAVNIPDTDPLGIGRTITATAQTAPESNITILSIPPLPAVHILDNAGGGSTGLTPATGGPTAIARKTSLLNYNRPQHHHLATGQPTSITLVSVGPFSHHHHMDEGKTVLTPIQVTHPTSEVISASLMIKSEDQNITELTSAVPITASTVYHLHPSHAPPAHHQIMNQPTNITTTTQPNDNFMRLLEAIEMTEVE